MNPKFPELFSISSLKTGTSVGANPPLFSLFLGLGIALASTPLVSSAQAQSAADVLNAVKQSEAKIQYTATQVVQRGGEREVAKIYRSGIKRRLEWLEPSVKKGDVMVDDGRSVTLFHQRDKSVIETQSVRRSPSFKPTEWKVGAPKTQNGKLVRVLSGPNGRSLVIDAGTKAIVRMEGARGTTVLQNIDYGMVSPAKFRFVPPAGAKVQRINGRLFSDLRAARRNTAWFKAPEKLPAGYNFESAVVGPSEVWLRYSNGQKRFSIFQQPAEDGAIKPQEVTGGWFWKGDGLRFLASDAPKNAIPNLASSMK